MEFMTLSNHFLIIILIIDKFRAGASREKLGSVAEEALAKPRS